MDENKTLSRLMTFKISEHLHNRLKNQAHVKKTSVACVIRNILDKNLTDKDKIYNLEL
jgi:predicted HicB family RNase H-like nuclease